MEIDTPNESNGSTTGSKENERYPVLDIHSGQGLPYAPEDFPNPGDKWCWKVGKRVSVSGHYLDRYLYLPHRLHKKFKSGGFASKASVERFVMETFPEVDINAFFASFSWKIPAGQIKGKGETISGNEKSSSQLGAAGCKAGNRMCSSLLDKNHPPPSVVKVCDVCCIEPGFCRDCCCILCSRTVNSANGARCFVRCEAIVEEGFICGHIAHIECGLRSYMAGTVGGSFGLDAEYYCRRCDGKTDLVSHAMNLFQSCESIQSGDEIEKILNICVLILRGSGKTNAKTLLHHVQAVMRKLQDGISYEDIWKREDTSAVTTGELSQSETDTLEVSNFKGPLQLGTPPQLSKSNFDSRIESLELEDRIQQTLLSLKKSQEAEYRLAENVLITQKNYLLNLYQELDKEKENLAKCFPSADASIIDAIFRRGDQIRTEFAKVAAMEAVAKGFGRTSKTVLREHFGVQSDD